MSLFETLDEVEIPKTDSVPELDQYSVEAVDDESAPYGRTASGRVRKKPLGTRSGRTGRKTVGSEQLARQAAKVLSQVNAVAAMGLMVGRLPATASALSGYNETFEEQVYEALLTDPQLCRSILRAGTAGAKVSLIICYGMLAATVIPPAIIEIREKRELKELDAL